MRRFTVIDQILSCERQMYRHFRPFAAVIHPEATEQEISYVEDELDVRLPMQYRAFLKSCDGLSVTSSPEDERRATWLCVMRTSGITLFSRNLREAQIESAGGEEKAPWYIGIAFIGDENFVQRGAPRDCEETEPPVLLHDLYAPDRSWTVVAKSFDEFLHRGLHSMATTAKGFEFFLPDGSFDLW